MTDTAHPPDETLDDLVRRVDPDRWLAVRFIGDAAARADILTLYAFNHELARIAPAVTNPLMGEIRLAWWREALDEIAQGRPVRRHPAAEALAEVVRRRPLDTAKLYRMVDARAADLDPTPFPDAVSLYGYLDDTAGALMDAAAEVLGAEASAAPSAARAWGVAGLARAHWIAGMPNRLPPDWSASDVSAATDSLLLTSRAELKGLPVEAFPAVAYATLARPYARRKDLTDLGKRARLVWATVRGKL